MDWIILKISLRISCVKLLERKIQGTGACHLGARVFHALLCQILAKTRHKKTGLKARSFESLYFVEYTVLMYKLLILLVGARRFELPTPCTPCKCATRLRYAPNKRAL